MHDQIEFIAQGAHGEISMKYTGKLTTNAVKRAYKRACDVLESPRIIVRTYALHAIATHQADITDDIMKLHNNRSIEIRARKN